MGDPGRLAGALEPACRSRERREWTAFLKRPVSCFGLNRTSRATLLLTAAVRWTDRNSWMIFVQAVGQTLAVSSDFQLALVFPPTQEMAIRDVRSGHAEVSNSLKFGSISSLLKTIRKPF